MIFTENELIQKSFFEHNDNTKKNIKFLMLLVKSNIFVRILNTKKKRKNKYLFIYLF